MSVYTNIDFLNGNDPDFIKAKNGTKAERKEWEESEGLMNDRPGAPMYLSTPETAKVIRETGDEYGGWLISVKDIPKDATHIIVWRG